MAKFVKDYYHVPYDHTIAFGGSGNDIGMLKCVKHGYLLQNAAVKSHIIASAISAKALC
ncbi:MULTISPECIES: HAD family hydrolase [Virgibacillus]|uniref:HAD family hydrolase n=1 Tax=Virgibacillus TaxID=84406 RepID=UPI001E6248AC|nr:MULTISPECIES: HAD hydrolase family protein [Virgibacillus]MED3738361.1 HAD hydrolase family protein [Virgibacillus pantothenticus]